MQTAQVLCIAGAGMSQLIACNFSWTTPDRHLLEQSMDLNVVERDSPTSTVVTVTELQMQMTLTTARHPGHDHSPLNEDFVHSTAFGGTRIFTIRMDKGVFLEQQQHKRLAKSKSIPPMARYSYRLIFSKSSNAGLRRLERGSLEIRAVVGLPLNSSCIRSSRRTWKREGSTIHQRNTDSAFSCERVQEGVPSIRDSRMKGNLNSGGKEELTSGY
jgi:hypothetical protein